MDRERIIEVEKVVDEEFLQESFDFLVKVGELPYKANRRAMVEIDMNRNSKRGLLEAQKAVDGINGWIGELEFFRDATERIAKEAVAVLRAP